MSVYRPTNITQPSHDVNAHGIVDIIKVSTLRQCRLFTLSGARADNNYYSRLDRPRPHFRRLSVRLSDTGFQLENKSVEISKLV